MDHNMTDHDLRDPKVTLNRDGLRNLSERGFESRETTLLNIKSSSKTLTPPTFMYR